MKKHNDSNFNLLELNFIADLGLSIFKFKKVLYFFIFSIAAHIALILSFFAYKSYLFLVVENKQVAFVLGLIIYLSIFSLLYYIYNKKVKVLNYTYNIMKDIKKLALKKEQISKNAKFTSKEKFINSLSNLIFFEKDTSITRIKEILDSELTAENLDTLITLEKSGYIEKIFNDSKLSDDEVSKKLVDLFINGA